MIQKSRKITVLMLAILAMYTIIANYSLVGYGSLYYFIVNPLFWFVFMITTTLLTTKTNEGTKLRGNVFEYTLIAALVNIGVYLLSYLFVDIGKNPYSTSLKGIVINIYVYILPIIAKEYTRFKLINNVYEKDKSFITVLTTAIYVFIDIGIIDISDTYNVTKLIFSDILPIIAENAMCSYIAMNKLYKPAIAYRIITSAYWLLAPILPKVTWIMTSVVDTIIPAILFIYIRYLRKKNEVQKSKEQVEVSDPKSIIPMAIVVILVLWFGMGVFPIRPIAIATGSMEKTIMVGDVVILKKCTANDLEVGDIVQYQKDNFTVVHRIISKYTEDGEIYFITKGDNNNAPDIQPVSESQILAKELFSIRYIGYPAIFLSKINWSSEPDTSSIEKGR